MAIPDNVVFANSYVLGLRIEPYAVFLRMDFVLSPSHPQYRPPPPNESACFRRGTLTIKGFKRLTWEATNVPPARDADAELDWGCLDVFRRTSEGWYLEGDWGNIVVESGDLFVDIPIHSVGARDL